nr:MAG TPA: hypothetical protein [Caudoviricetes sp.]
MRKEIRYNIAWKLLKGVKGNESAHRRSSAPI